VREYLADGGLAAGGGAINGDEIWGTGGRHLAA
jgi:hypothetical protein